MLSPPHSFHLKTWAIIMESTRQKTFRLLRAILPVPVILVFTLLLSFNLSAVGSFKVVRVSDGETINIHSKTKTCTFRLVGIDAPETSKTKHEPAQPFSQAATKHLAGLVLNKSVEIKNMAPIAMVKPSQKFMQRSQCQSGNGKSGIS
jgi:hypothetical protein